MFTRRSTIIQAEEILKFVGLPISDIGFKQWLSATGDEELILEDGDYRTYIERPEHGYCLTFTDEAVFLGIDDKTIGSGGLIFSGVFFYSEGKDGYKQFQGKLPQNVKFEDEQEDLKIKLGSVESFHRGEDDALISERWDFDKLKFHITYNNVGTIDLISISQPDGT